jgi:hypothetical protein
MHKGARTDLCGGRGVTRVPTATDPIIDANRWDYSKLAHDTEQPDQWHGCLLCSVRGRQHQVSGYSGHHDNVVKPHDQWQHGYGWAGVYHKQPGPTVSKDLSHSTWR